jgi:hypothetical protein
MELGCKFMVVTGEPINALKVFFICLHIIVRTKQQYFFLCHVQKTYFFLCLQVVYIIIF